MEKLRDNLSEETNYKEKISRLVGEQKFGEAINYLHQVIDYDKDNTQAKVLLEQVKKINQFQSRDIFAQTNLDMDPWLE
ncbi:MAG: hypothetical protein PHE03_05655 [Bacteroidales bacterium]|nr:hypothetical protein [Bacteroidales bacterium]MDD3891773.1 hypothetical protein [Bacteroidales bacterium]